jgi:hypothetical protein
MREDMAKVIVERPRVLDSIPRKGRPRPLEEEPKQLGMRRAWKERHGCKMLNENLVPLRRYLERQVGRPWDKVYSEIAQRLRVDSTVQQHVRDHLRDFVATRPRRGISTWYKWGGEALWHQALYVDPRDGILKRTDRLPEVKARRRQEAERLRTKPVECVILSSTRELRVLDGIWYEVELAPLPEPEYRPDTEIKRWARKNRAIEMKIVVRRLKTPPVFDVVRRTSVWAGPSVDEEFAWRCFRREHPDRRYAAAKRQLCRRELRRHGLVNQCKDED